MPPPATQHKHLCGPNSKGSRYRRELLPNPKARTIASVRARKQATSVYDEAAKKKEAEEEAEQAAAAKKAKARRSSGASASAKGKAKASNKRGRGKKKAAEEDKDEAMSDA